MALSVTWAVHGQSGYPITATIAGEGSSVGAMSMSREAVDRAALLSSGQQQMMPRVFTPTLPRATYTRYPWKTDIMATVFWIGELPTENNPTPNTKSSWDTQWVSSFGGYDDPDPSHRVMYPEFRPAAFVPKQNPFYVALPYNDLLDYKTTKPEAFKMIPWMKETFSRHGRSVCRDRWVAIRVGNRICYAQWSDCGPFVTDDVAYVFGTARPSNAKNGGAGIDLSPAVRDYLGMSNKAKCDWRFVDVHEVPDGPWRRLGDNNHFVQRRTTAAPKDMVASRLEELRRQRDEWFQKNGNDHLRKR